MDITGKKAENNNCNFILSNTYLAGFYYIIDDIKNKCDKEQDNIILVVPDKFSLNAEQIFMERTGFSSIFNVWLTTLSRLINKVVGNDNKLVVLSKNSGTMLVSKIIQDNINKIDTYKKMANNYSLAQTMYNVINLLKSSGVKPDELKNNFNDTNFGLKIKDIYIIYSEYEKYMKNNIDSITRLQIFDKKVMNDEYIKNSHVYFAMFDSFTNVQIDSLANIAKNAKSFNISLCSNTLQSNSHIFDNSIFQKINSIFKDNNIKINIINTILNGTNMQNYLAKNLFSLETQKDENDKNINNFDKNVQKNTKKTDIFNNFTQKSQINKLETNNIKLVECSSVAEEIRYVASKIKYLVMQRKYSFDDINVAVNGIEDYKLTVQQIFEEYDLPYYLDDKRTLLDHYFVRNIFKIADFISGQKTLNNAIDIVMSPMFNYDYLCKLDFQNYCLKHNVLGTEYYNSFIDDGSKNYINAEEIRQKVFKNIDFFEKNLKKLSTVADFKDCLIDYLQTIDAKHVIENNAMLQEDILQKQIDNEVYAKFLNAFDEAINIISDAKTDIKTFFEMLKSCLESVNLLSVPIKCDAIFVGDASQSTYFPRKIMFIMGSTQKRMPSFASDSGTLTDTEIALFKSNNNIRPTIKELNKREKFKLFNLVTIPSDRLELTYSTLINGQVEFKSEFISAIQSIVTTNGLPINIEKYELEELKIFDNTEESLPSFMVGTLKNAVRISKGKSDNLKYILTKNFNDILMFAENQYKDKSVRFKISDIKQKLFNNDTTSISQIEKYFKCPFMQFVDYAIKPKENPKFEIDTVDIGNILHCVAEYFVNRYIKRGFMFNQDIKKEVSDIYEQVIKRDDFKQFEKNKFAIDNLKSEAYRFCLAIKKQIESSDFKPLYTEKKFSNFKIANDLTINGKVDRVDVFEFDNTNIKSNLKNENNQNDALLSDAKKYIRVIDYKTGKDKFSYADIYFGIKLQLMVYLSAIVKELHAVPVSTGYMHIKNNFDDFFDDEYKSFKLDGVTLKNDGMILRLDKNLTSNNSSNLIYVDFIKSGYSYYCSRYLLSEKEFNDLQVYALNILNNATTEMLQGYIEPKPYKVSSNNFACKYCKWKSLCHYKINENGYRDITPKTKEDFTFEEKQ